MTSVRRNTYVLNTSSVLPVSQPGDHSGMDRQNLMRLKVNRIALIQELRVEHIVQYLVKTGVLTDLDLRKIEKGTTPPDRTRLFIDLLTSKTKETEWYKHFRLALLNPDANINVTKKYRYLVEFLDNTIIHRPTSQGNLFRDFALQPVSKQPNQTIYAFPHYNTLPPITKTSADIDPDCEERKESPNILRIHDSDSREFPTPRDQEGDSKQESWTKSRVDTEGSPVHPGSGSIVKGYIHHWVPVPQDFQLESLIKEPRELFRSLEHSTSLEDQGQLQHEKQALAWAKNLEFMCHMYRCKIIPNNIDLCKCVVMENILAKPDQFHMLAKYCVQLHSEHGVNLLQDIHQSFLDFVNRLKPNDSTDKLRDTINLAFNLTDFFSELNHSKLAEGTLTAILLFLHLHPKLETLMATYKGTVKFMQLMNKEYNFRGANRAYLRATEVTWRIEKLSFGQDLVEKGEMYLELSHMMLEDGSINSAYSWAFKSLQHVTANEKVSVINVLCNAVLAYCAKWNIKRAEKIAVQAVQLAREYFGSRHPLYLKALLTYCYYSNEFRQDQAGLEIAKHTLEVAKSTYGVDTPQQAHAHRVLCKALVVAEDFDNDEYLFHAGEAASIAERYYPPTHPAMYLFHFTKGLALHVKASHAAYSEQEALLNMALGEVKQARSLVEQHFGDISLRHAQILGLLAQISTKLGGYDVAEALLVSSENMLNLCLPPRNNYLLVARATLAMFYTMDPVNRPEEARILLEKVVKSLDSPGVKVKWVVHVFDHLIALHQSQHLNKEAAIVEAQKEEWLENNPAHSSPITLSDLMKSPRPYHEFLADFNIWQKHVDRLREASFL